MNKILMTLIFACACGGATTSAAPTTTATAHAPAVPAEHRDMIAKIDLYLRDPAAGDPSAIQSFVRESSAVMVVFDQRLIPMTPGLPEGTNALLLVGFAAGNARAQLASGVTHDSPVDGVRGMLAVYRFLKAKNSAVSSPNFDELVAREAAGTLDTAVAESLHAK